MVLAISLILIGRATLVFSQIPNEKKLTDQSNINQNFNATLTGNQQMPSVKTKGFGTASFELLDNNTILHYQISVLDIQNITGIHIHQGKSSGEKGDVIVNIYESKENILLNQNGTKLSQNESSSVTIGGNTEFFMASGTINNSDLKRTFIRKEYS